MKRVYFDNAATSWPKPDAVYDQCDHFLRSLGTAAGRGGYSDAVRVDQRIKKTRSSLARMLDVPNDDHLVFTYSGTDSLNLAIRGAIRRSDHVVATICEHNSVLRPLRWLQDEQQIDVSWIECDDQGYVAAESVLQAVRDDTRLVAVIHASNVTGALQPVEDICHALKDHAAITLVDAAQTVGHMPLSFQSIGCDLLAAPAHKGLLAPAGTGFLAMSENAANELQPLRLGGTGSFSESDVMPSTLPDRFEAGNLNVAGIFGMGAAIEWLEEHGTDAIAQHEHRLTQKLLDGLCQIPNVILYGPPPSNHRRLGVVGFNLVDFSPQEVGSLLDQIGGIQVRTGFHCAPRMHRRLETDTMGGCVRVSFGWSNSDEEVDQFLNVVQQLGQA